MASMIRYEGSYANMNFQTISIPKGILATFLSEKAGLGKHSYLKYALDIDIMQQSITYRVNLSIPRLNEFVSMTARKAIILQKSRPHKATQDHTLHSGQIG